MSLNIRKKISLSFTFFIVTSTLIWSINFFHHYQLTKKIELIEQKIDLLNTVLECRRYEKNFFLYFNRSDLKEAVTYAESAEKKQADIIDKYKDALRHLPVQSHLSDLKEYKSLLVTLIKTDKHDAELKTYYHKQIRAIGKKITDSIEKIVLNERENIRILVNKTNVYLYLALIAIFILTAATGTFMALNVNIPLKNIEMAIHKIAKGDYTSIPPISTGDIFESLVNSVNQMIEVLNRRNEQLVHAEKLAALGTLTSGVAHELNNPLNNMSTSVQILAEELEDGDVEYKRMLLQETEAQIDRARDIIKALLEFSRDRSFVSQVVNIKALIQKTMKLIKGEIPSNVTQHFELEDSLEGKVGPYRIQRVLMNLVINAVHAMEEGGGELTIIAKQVDEDTFCFQVKDTGKGVGKEDMEKIFDPFYTTKDVGKGTGLGLSISHGIIESHGGRIEVESEIGKGAVFTVLLPVRGEFPEIS
ncbi:MAG: hypothetical protein GY749_23255 [Desulfobacteraceae bacterium]|nr:hypothetical protein [Desulfobacteraceae bacterium]